MPTTLKGWAGLCLLLAAMLFPSLSHAGSAQSCFSLKYQWERFWDNVHEAGSVEEMLRRFPPPPEIPIEKATQMIEEALSTDRQTIGERHFNKCMGREASLMLTQSEDWTTHKYKRCAHLARFALSLLQTHREMGLPWNRIHVDPSSEAIKQVVMEHEGDQKQLFDKVMGDCLGTAT